MWRLTIVVVGIFLVGPLIQNVNSLRMTKMEVPLHVAAGQSVYLRCCYKMEGDELYSVKWYKGISEFYRYLPKDHPPAQVYEVQGVTVNLTGSNATVVKLQSVSLLSSGHYRCEVSAEAPSFITVSDEKEMNVIALPPEGPRITGGHSKYDIGDYVRVNCTSLTSKPAAVLSWTINHDSAPKEFLREYPSIVHETGLETSILGLHFKVRGSHFKSGEMKLQCSASIAPLYYKSIEEAVFRSDEVPPVLESKAPTVHGKNPVSENHRNNGRSALTYSLWWSILSLLRLLFQE